MEKLSKQIILHIKESIRLVLILSIGVFLFVLFFQPFEIKADDSNNGLIIISGLSGIVFFIILIVRIGINQVLKEQGKKSDSFAFRFLEALVITALMSVSFTFYLHYVGSESVTFYAVFKITTICSFVAAVYSVSNYITEVKKQNERLVAQNKSLMDGMVVHEDKDQPEEKISFASDNVNENIELEVSEIVLIKSANNYIELVYSQNNDLKKKLIRNTLKNVELQIKAYQDFVRCHRTCLVNTFYVEQLNNIKGNYSLRIKNFNDEIPVSRQYLLAVKDRLLKKQG